MVAASLPCVVLRGVSVCLPELQLKNLDTYNSQIAVKPLRKRSEFIALRSGKRASNAYLTLQSLKRDQQDDEPVCRVGYTVTTRVGNAVERNRIKRRLRSAVREVFPLKAKAGYDYCLIARRATLTEPYGTIVSQLSMALDRVHRNGAKGPRKSD